MGVQIDRKLFQIEFRTVPANQKIMGQITAPETDLGTQRFVPGRRALVTPYGKRVAAKTVLKTPKGLYYLVGSSADNDAQRLNYTVSHLFPLTDQVNILRSTRTTDPVTGQVISNTPAIIQGGVWVALESALEARDNMAVPEKEYRIVTGYPIEEGDLLSNNMQVRLVQEFLGVYVGVVR